MKTSPGQTLIEPILAVAIFSIIIVPLVSSISNLSAAQVRSRHQIEAVQYARESLEFAYNQAVNAEDWGDFLETHLGTQTEFVGGRYTRQTTIEKVKRNGDGNLAENDGTEDKKTVRVAVQVSWTEKDQDHSEELVTYLINFEDL